MFYIPSDAQDASKRMTTSTRTHLLLEAMEAPATPATNNPGDENQHP